MKKVDADVTDTWTGGGKCVEIQDLFQGGCVGSSHLRIIDVDGNPPHWKDTGGFPTQGVLPDNW